MTPPTPSPDQLPAATSAFAGGRALVLALNPEDAVFGCAGAILRHVGAGDPVALAVLADAPGTDPAPAGAPAAGLDPLRRAAALLGCAEPEFWALPAAAVEYGERLIQRIVALARAADAQWIYATAPSEPEPGRRVLGLAALEAVRRLGGGRRLAFYEVGGALAATHLLDISDLRERKRAALACFGETPCAGLAALIEGRDAYRSYPWRPQIAAAEAYRVVAALPPGDPVTAWPWAALPATAEPQGATAPPLISVIIRTMGRPELADALAAVAAQSYPHLEVVVVQAAGGAPLPLPEWCGRFPLRLLADGEPRRRSRAANLGLREARGLYCAFLDEDDWWLPDHLAQLAAALADPGGARAAYAGVSCVRGEGGGWQEVHRFNDPYNHGRLLVENFIPMHAVLFERSLTEAGCAFDEGLERYEDWDFWLKVARATPMRHVPAVTAVYRLGSDGGFGVDAPGSEVAQARALFFAKWRAQWSVAELEVILERARAAEGIPVLQRQIALVESQRDALAEAREALARQAGGQADEITALKALLAQRQQAFEEALDQQGQELRGRLAVEETERRRAEARLQELHESTSWRITAPVRGARRLLGRAAALGRRSLGRSIGLGRGLYRRLLPFSWRQRLAPSLASLVSQLPVAVPADTAPGLWSPPAPFDLIRLKAAELPERADELLLPTSEAPEVSVIIPVYNNPTYTLECLMSVARHPPRAAFEVIVADDGSNEANRALLRRVRGIRLLENPTNLGFLRSCNHAARAARGRYLMFLNNDTQVRGPWLDSLLELFALDRVGLVGSKLLYPSGHLQEAGAAMGGDGVATLVGLNGDPDSPAYNRVREVDYCSGASFMIERGLFERIGGFDERYAPAYYEDSDLCFAVREQGWRVIYQPASEVIHHLSVSMQGQEAKLARIEASRAKFLEKWRVRLAALNRVRLIAFYLPQFHPIPENDAWWGPGFTEWSNVAKARPNFEGHLQPRLPADLGFYDLRLAEVRARQAELARAHGVYGFCYYYYWFNGRRLLNRPLDEVLAGNEPDFPFCVCWANENWTRRWDGKESEILMEQHYSPEDDVAFIRALFPLFADPRYIRIDGRPLLVVYSADELPDTQATTDRWRQECRQAGIGEIYLARVINFKARGELLPGFDAGIEFPPQGGPAVDAPRPEAMTNPEFRGRFFDYPATARAFAARDYQQKVFRGVMPSWDNTARRQNDAHTFLGATPELYQEWLRQVVKSTRELQFGEERIVFINAWNEWAEGAALEPDRSHGSAYLQATRQALAAVLGAAGDPPAASGTP